MRSHRFRLTLLAAALFVLAWFQGQSFLQAEPLCRTESDCLALERARLERDGPDPISFVNALDDDRAAQPTLSFVYDDEVLCQWKAEPNTRKVVTLEYDAFGIVVKCDVQSKPLRDTKLWTMDYLARPDVACYDERSRTVERCDQIDSTGTE